MKFDAETRGKKHEIELVETRLYWNVTLTEKGKEKEKQSYKIPKLDYQEMDQGINFLFNNMSFMIDIVNAGLEYKVYTRGSYRVIPIFNDEMILHESLKKRKVVGNPNQLRAEMPGKIVDILVRKGSHVQEHEPVIIMEAMKMENELRVPRDVVIKEVRVKVGDNVDAGEALLVYEK